jgi:hypothetical protein
MSDAPHIDLGKQTSTIQVRISYRIIELFSEGLYASPNKAVEELVSNAFDAGASNVHIVLSPDRTIDDAFIAVVDDGIAMGAQELNEHWFIGVSNKRKIAPSKLPKGRKQIGKFGIGKLATFVLSRYLTHICRRGNKYFAATMDYNKIPEGEGGGLQTEEKVEIPLRMLTEAQAKAALQPFISGSKSGYKAIPLFGNKSAKTWTVAIMTGLRPMATEIKKGRLAWVLRTAMPLRDDFNIYLDGDELSPSKASVKLLKRWTVGKDLKKLSKPAPDDLEVSEDSKGGKDYRYGVTHPALGRVTGYAELYDDFLTGGKAEQIGRSNGFFVYVRGRLINEDDALFGIPALRHGTFARFRMVVHVDKLDDELRSSREGVRNGPLVTIARNLLHGIFNLVRNWDEEHEAQQTPDVRATGRIAATAGSLTRRPLLSLVKAVLDAKAEPQYTIVERHLSPAKGRQLLDTLRQRAESDEGLVLQTEMADLAQDVGIAQLDMRSGVLRINTLHPFVTMYRDELGLGKDTLILMAMTEVLTEARLFELGVHSPTVREVMEYRDELLRQFTRSARKRSANLVAQALMDAASDQDLLEDELVAAFQSMGFNAVRIGGSKRADGRAEAHLGAYQGKEQRYAVSLEAKSKEDPTKKVTAKSVDVGAVIQHREDIHCDHAVVVAPYFPASKRDGSNLVKQAKHDAKLSGHTITYIRIHDLARLVRVVPLKCVGLDRLHGLFSTCTSPEEASAWIDELAAEQPVKRPPLREILETIWAIQQERPFEPVEFAAITTALQINEKIVLRKDEIIDLCKAMSMMAPQVVLRETTVELTHPPDGIIETFGVAIRTFPEEEQTASIFKL